MYKLKENGIEGFESQFLYTFLRLFRLSNAFFRNQKNVNTFKLEGAFYTSRSTPKMLKFQPIPLFIFYSPFKKQMHQNFSSWKIIHFRNVKREAHSIFNDKIYVCFNLILSVVVPVPISQVKGWIVSLFRKMIASF